MKQFVLLFMVVTLCISSCKQRSLNSNIETSKAIAEGVDDGLNFKDGEKPSGRLFPDKLRDLPNEIIAAHYPNPCYATLEDSMYIWKHNTSIETKQDLQIVEYGSFVYTKNGWYLRTTMSVKEFEEYYNCKNGLLKKGVTYSDNANWRRGKKLTAGDAMWYYIAKDKNGRLLKGTAPIETEAKLINSTAYNARISSSNISWTGYGEIGSYSLTGKIELKEAKIQMEGDSINAASIIINMATITHEDKNLETHLKDKDFFDVTKFATAIFETENLEYVNESSAIAVGKLTVKGITQRIKIPLTITKNGSSKIIKGKISVDRTKYGIKYNSKSFFGNLGDQAIKNNFDLEFTIEIKS